MECQPCDSKKIFKVFEASKRKKTKKKHDGTEDNSIATDDSNSHYCRPASRKNSLDAVANPQAGDTKHDNGHSKRDSSPPRSPRRHRRPAREQSLALKEGLASTPRSESPPEDDGAIGVVPKDQDSFIYALLEEAIKRDKKKHRHSRRRDEKTSNRERDTSSPRERRHHHRRRRESSRGNEKERVKSPSPNIDQAALLETFAKICVKLNEKSSNPKNCSEVQRNLSHKSLQCEVTKRDLNELVEKPIKLRSRQNSGEQLPVSRVRSRENTSVRVKSFERLPSKFCCNDSKDKHSCFDHRYEKDNLIHSSRLDVRGQGEERFCDHHMLQPVPTRSCIDNYKPRETLDRDYREFLESRNIRRFDEERRRCEQKASRRFDEERSRCDQKASRSFEIYKESFVDDGYKKTSRSENNNNKEQRYDNRDIRGVRESRYNVKSIQNDKYFDEKQFCNQVRQINKEKKSKRNLDRCDRNSLDSRDDFRERDRFSEKERDSGLSVADGENSTVSGRSNYMRAVKQEIAEQREAMDKMMKLWKELMRCFKELPQNAGNSQHVHESAENARDSATAQLKLWKECMRRYETVARDVGDTDARLMEEINKQRSEMAEMATMWQECLQRYRDISCDFKNLKQKLATRESTTRVAAVPLNCADGEGTVPLQPYRHPHAYPPMPPVGYPPPGPAGVSPMRCHRSGPPPPAWWWSQEEPQSLRRRSSPESRASRERTRRHKERERDISRHKEKSKPSASRSEHRHRKR